MDYVISRCKFINNVDKVIVATSSLQQDDEIAKWCEKHLVTCFRGSEKDVLSRFYDCAVQYSPDYVIRVTADCPFVDFELGSLVIDAMIAKPADLVVIRGSLPRGLAVEVMSFKALDTMYREGREHRHREHVTYYAMDHPDQFTHTIVQAPIEICQPQLRLTLDTQEDYKLCGLIAEHFDGDLLVPSREVIRYLLDHPEIASINATIKQKPVDG